MIENLAHNLEELFQEIVETGRENGVVDQEAYHELVDEVIETHREMGEIHDDEPIDSMVELLKDRWSDYQSALGLESKHPLL